MNRSSLFPVSLLISCTLWFVPCTASNVLETALVCPDSQSVKYGYVDSLGNNVEYEIVYKFSHGLAVARARGLDGKFGYIDETGKLIIGLRFEWAGAFSEGLAEVCFDGKYGFIDTAGKPVVQPKFDYARPFMEGLAAVRLENKWGFIDAKGHLVIPYSYFDAYGFSNGLAPVAIGAWNKWGCIDKKGNIVFEQRFSRVHAFSEGLLPATLDGKKWGYIDATGQFVIEPSFDYAFPFVGDLARVCMRNPEYSGSGDGVIVDGLSGLIDKEGRYVQKPSQ